MSSCTGYSTRLCFLPLALFLCTLLSALNTHADALSAQKIIGNWSATEGPLAGVEIAIWTDEQLPSPQNTSKFFQMQGMVIYPNTPDCNASIVINTQAHDVWASMQYRLEALADVPNRGFQISIPASENPSLQQRRTCQQKWSDVSKTVIAPENVGGNLLIQLYGNNYEPYFNELSRREPSNTMQEAIASYIGETPSRQELSLINSPNSISEELITQLPTSCGMYIFDYEALKDSISESLEFDSIAATQSNSGMSLVTEERMNVGVTTKELPLPEHLEIPSFSISWLDYHRGEEEPSTEDCSNVEIAYRVVKHIRDGDIPLTEVATQVPSKTTPEGKIVDLTGFYLVDSSGVDYISHNGFDIDINPARMARHFGTTNIYLPGDRTRTGVWNVAEQSLLVSNTKKNSATGKVTEDYEDGVQIITFGQDTSLSETYEQAVWLATTYNVRGTPGGSDISDSAPCIEWNLGENDATNGCLLRSPLTASQLRPVYLTEHEDTAIELFKGLSPDAQMLTRSSESAGCQTEALCSLPGGEYLDAMMRLDLKTLDRLDTEYLGAYQNFMDSNPLIELSDAIGGDLDFSVTLSMSAAAMREYLFNYRENASTCLGDTTTYTARSSSDSVIEVDGYGNRRTIYEGQNFSDEYLVPSAMLGLCREICETRGVTYSFFGDHEVMQGIRQLQSTQSCSSDVIKTFEQRLVELRTIRNDRRNTEPTLVRNTI